MAGVHAAADPDGVAFLRSHSPKVPELQLVRVREPEDTVRSIGDARMHRPPLDPRFEIWLLFLGVAREDLAAFSQAGEVWQLAFADEAFHQGRGQFVEF